MIAAEGANLKGFNKEITGNKEEKINIGFNLHYTEVDALLNPDGILYKMRKDGIIIPVSLDLQEADVDEELISRNDVKLNNEYAESLFLMGTALNSISGAT